MSTNHQVRLAERPAPGLPQPSVWKFTEEPVGEVPDGSVLVKVLYCSLDPAMRTWMNEGRSYVPPVGIGEVMRAAGIGQIVESKASGLKAGDFVNGVFGVQEYAVVKGAEVLPLSAKEDELPVHLGALGLSGITAYFGLTDIGRIKSGETVVISAAAGSVGSIAGQIAKALGCRVVGVAGGADKCRALVETLGFDEAIDYKAAGFDKALRAACPKGVDVYFDNVGGAVLNAVLKNLARGARIVICGAVSQYNATEVGSGPTAYMNLLVARARMEGFVIFDYEKRYGEARKAISDWISNGKINPVTHVVEGLNNFPTALSKLFAGENIGKFVLKIASSA
jgi:NADPH-dependent curcumin reductase CurA